MILVPLNSSRSAAAPLVSGMSLAVPGVRSEEVEVKGEPADHTHTETTPTRLAWFLLGVLRVAAETEQQLQVRPGSHPQPLLPQLLGCSLLLLHSLLSGQYSTPASSEAVLVSCVL